MTMIQSYRSRRGSVARRVLEAVAIGVLEAAYTVKLYVEAEIDRRQTARLLGFDDTVLKDIGITRGDVHGALLTSAGEKASHHLARERDARRRAELARRKERQAR